MSHVELDALSKGLAVVSHELNIRRQRKRNVCRALENPEVGVL